MNAPNEVPFHHVPGAGFRRIWTRTWVTPTLSVAVPLIVTAPGRDATWIVALFSGCSALSGDCTMTGAVVSAEPTVLKFTGPAGVVSATNDESTAVAVT